MVNRRLWFRGKPAAFRPMFPDRGQWTPTAGASSPGIDDVVDPPTHSPGSEDDDEPVESTGRRLLFINQYYWPDHASTAQHLTDLAESLAARGYECHVLCAQGRYQAGARLRSRMRFTREFTFTGSARRRWAGARHSRGWPITSAFMLAPWPGPCACPGSTPW